MRHWICIPVFLTCLPICKYLVTRSGERDVQTRKLKSQVWLCVCTVYSYRSWWRWKSWMFFARSSISRCQLNDKESLNRCSASSLTLNLGRISQFLMDGWLGRDCQNCATLHSTAIGELRGMVGWGLISFHHTLRSVNDVTEGITQESPMGGSWVIPRTVDKMVWISAQWVLPTTR